MVTTRTEMPVKLKTQGTLVPVRLRRLSVAMALAMYFTGAPAAGQSSSPEPPPEPAEISASPAHSSAAPPLLTVAEFRDLSYEAARQRQLVRVRGTVTWVNRDWSLLFLHDEGEQIKVVLLKDVDIEEGRRVEITGYIAPGDATRILVLESLRDLGPATVPEPRKLDASTTVSSNLLDQWVEIRGDVYTVAEHEKRLFFHLTTGQFGVYVYAGRQPELFPLSRFRSARVRVRGVLAQADDPGARGGLVFLVPPSAVCEVVSGEQTAKEQEQTSEEREQTTEERKQTTEQRDQATEERSVEPVSAINWYAAEHGKDLSPSRVRGFVTARSGTGRLYVSDESASLMVECRDPGVTQTIRRGDAVEIDGIMVHDSKPPYMTDAFVRVLGQGHTEAPRRVSAEAAADHPAELLELEGTVVRTDTDRNLILTRFKQVYFQVRLKESEAALARNLAGGSRLRVVGGCWPQGNSAARFSIDASQVEVLFGIPAETAAEDIHFGADAKAFASAPQPGSRAHGASLRPDARWRIGLRILAGGVLVTLAALIAWLSFRRHREQKQFHDSIHGQLSDLSHVARLNTLSEMVGALAHELNQPLSSVSNNAAAAELISRNDPPDGKKLAGLLDNIKKESHRAGEIIRRLRNLIQRKTPGKMPLDLSQVIEEAMGLFRTQEITAARLIEIHVEPGLPLVKADGIQIQQVILNLLVNAHEATSELTDRQPRISVSAFAGEGCVKVSVEDNGPGFSCSHPETVFEAYFTTKAEGTGLGLSISRAIVEAHGGRITAERATPFGARICLALPSVD